MLVIRATADGVVKMTLIPKHQVKWAMPNQGVWCQSSVNSWGKPKPQCYSSGVIETSLRSMRFRASSLTRLETLATQARSKPEDYYHVNTFFTSLDKILAEIEIRLIQWK